MQRYSLEFILHAFNASSKIIKNSLAEFAENIEITDCQDSYGRGKNFKVNVQTEDPTLIFDVCSQFGRIKTVKVDELK
jgi:dihydroxyacetone kinase-like predicted kinase